jgi:hypothetical protein
MAFSARGCSQNSPATSLEKVAISGPANLKHTRKELKLMSMAVSINPIARFLGGIHIPPQGLKKHMTFDQARRLFGVDKEQSMYRTVGSYGISVRPEKGHYVIHVRNAGIVPAV